MDMFTPVEVLEAATGEFDCPGMLAINTPLDSLFADYNQKARQIRDLADAVATLPVVNYFLEAYTVANRDRGAPSAHGLFDVNSGIAALGADFWMRAIRLTDTLDVMPAAKRNEWNKQVRELKCPEFNEDNVRSTLRALILEREVFFAQKVDGIFRTLSGSHVTNNPSGFGKRMIMNRMRDAWGSVDFTRVEYLHDLRVIIASFLGREKPGNGSTSDIYKHIALDGQWNEIDGGALRIRAYKVGTAHMEVHPDVAWRLNMVLASLYPAAIPDRFRKKPTTKLREFVLRNDVISQRVLDELSRVIDRARFHNHRAVNISGEHLKWRKELEHVFRSLGAVETRTGFWEFDFQFREVILEVVRTGLLPDRRSFQFYPTPARLAGELVDLAGIEDHHTVLEPSAGVGGIAKFLPADRTKCVEVSELHSKVLSAMGYDVDCADFLTWKPTHRFDRICANPPFSGGRALAHVRHAASMLAPGGRLVAIVPSGMRDTVISPDLKHTWGPNRPDEFSDASVVVTTLVLDAP